MNQKDDVIREINELPKFELTGIFYDKDKKEAPQFRGVKEIPSNRLIAVVSDIYQLVQFEEVFLPLLKDINDLEGCVTYYNGKGFLEIYPEGESFKITNGHENQRIGMLIKISVDKTIAVTANFSILFNNYRIPIPAKVKSFRKIHIGETIKMTEDFLSVMSDVKETWKTIVTDLSKSFISMEDFENILARVRMKNVKKDEEILEKINNGQYTFWDLFLVLIEKVSNRKYKNEVNKLEKLKLISETIFDYSVIFRI